MFDHLSVIHYWKYIVLLGALWRHLLYHENGEKHILYHILSCTKCAMQPCSLSNSVCYLRDDKCLKWYKVYSK